MKCSNCGAELTDEMFVANMCFNCGNPTEESKRAFEKEQEKIQENTKNALKKAIDAKKREADALVKNHMLTTSFNFEGYKITKYLGLVAGETIIGTGFLSTWDAALSDMFGVEATEYTKKIIFSKEQVVADMIKKSVEKGGNAIIGVSFNISSFSGDLIGVSVNGTSVFVKKDEDEQ